MNLSSKYPVLGPEYRYLISHSLRRGLLDISKSISIFPADKSPNLDPNWILEYSVPAQPGVMPQNSSGSRKSSLALQNLHKRAKFSSSIGRKTRQDSCRHHQTLIQQPFCTPTQLNPVSYPRTSSDMYVMILQIHQTTTLFPEPHSAFHTHTHTHTQTHIFRHVFDDPPAVNQRRKIFRVESNGLTTAQLPSHNTEVLS